MGNNITRNKENLFGLLFQKKFYGIVLLMSIAIMTVHTTIFKGDIGFTNIAKLAYPVIVADILMAMLFFQKSVKYKESYYRNLPVVINESKEFDSAIDNGMATMIVNLIIAFVTSTYSFDSLITLSLVFTVYAVYIYFVLTSLMKERLELNINRKSL